MTEAEFVAEFDKSAKGAFKNNTIYINREKIAGLKNPGLQYQLTLLHEALHFGINGWVENNKKSKLYEELRVFNGQVVLALAASNHPYAGIMATILANDPEELLTHGIATPFLQDFLRQMDVKKPDSGWSKFVDFVAKLLGLTDTSALNKVLELSDRILKEANPNAESSQATVPAFETEIAELKKELDYLYNTQDSFDSDRVSEIESRLSELQNELNSLFTVPEANSEPPDAARSAESRGETVAEGISDEQLEQKAAAKKKAERLSSARRAYTMLKNERAWPNQVANYLNHKADRDMFNRLRNEGVDPAQAMAQVIASIEPNPELRNAAVEPILPAEVITKAAVDAAQLNSRENTKTVAARSIPETLINFVKDTAGTALTLAKALSVRKLGEKLTDIWARRSGKTLDLLMTEHPIIRILRDPGSREQFFEQAGTTLAEEQALMTFADFAVEFVRELDANIQKLPTSSDALANLLAKNPMYYWVDETTGKLDRNLATAMALEAMQHLVGSGSQSTWNSPEAMRSMLGLEETAPITGQMIRAVGRGRSQTSVVQQLGNAIAAHLNVKQKQGTKPQIDQVLAASLGAQALLVLKSLNVNANDDNGNPTTKSRIFRHEISRAEWNDIAGQSIESQTAGEEGTILMISNNVGPVFDQETGKWPRRDVNSSLREAVHEGRGIFGKLFGSTGTTRAPQFEKPTEKDIPKKITRTNANTPTDMRERMLHDAQKAWRAETDITDFIEKFENPEDYLAIAHAYLTEKELNQLHDLERVGAKGRNDGLMRDLTEALNWGRQYRRREFYLTMRQTRSGRFIYDSNVINPQANKLHRFMFVREGWVRHIDKRDPSSMTDTQREEWHSMMMAIGLSMGIKTDSTPVAEVARQVEEAFTTDTKWRAAMNVLQNAGETFSEDDVATLKEVLGKMGTHALAGLVAANKWYSAELGSAVAISLPHETDGVTNGYIIGLLQTPPPQGITPAYKALLNAGGIYFDGNPWENLAQFKAEGNLDNYQHMSIVIGV